MTIKTVLLPRSEHGNDPNDHRDEPGYLDRAKPLQTDPPGSDQAALERERLAKLRAFMDEHGVILDRALLERECTGAEFVWDTYTARKMVTLLVSMGGLGKSQLAIYALVCMAAGYDPGDVRKPAKKRRVLLVTLEDTLEIVLERIQKAVRVLSSLAGVPEEVIRADITGDRFAILPLYGTEFSVASPIPGGAVMVTPDLGILKRWIAQRMPGGVDQIAVDTLVRSHQAAENDNIAMAKVLVAFEQLARDTDAAVALLAHVPKAAAGERGSHVARGASSITDNARSSMNLTPATAADVSGFGNVEPEWIDPENPRLLRLTHSKSNYGPKAPPAWYLLKGGWIEPFTPVLSSENGDERRYRALYDWWTQKHASKPFTKTTAEEALDSVKEFDGSLSKAKLRALIVWAVVQEHAVAVSLGVVTKEGVTPSKNPETVYYRLRPLPERPAG